MSGPFTSTPTDVMAPREPEVPPRRRWLRRLVVTGVTGIVLVLLAVGVLLALTPDVHDAEARAAGIDRVHRVAGPTSPVPPRFADALIATEDSRFYATPGIDPVSVARAVGSVITGHGDGGGATLEQQLAKQLYTGGNEGGLGTKTEQVTLAVKLDTAYTKQQILEMYAAVVYFGHGYWGLDAASRGYFGIAPAQLSWAQAALLAGLVQAPTVYDPVIHPEFALAREQQVLNRLVVTGKLAPAAAAAAAAEPLHIVAR